MRENTNLSCPNCRGALEAFTDIKDIYKCPREDIVWKVSDRENGIFLEMLYAPSSYRGIMIARV